MATTPTSSPVKVLAYDHIKVSISDIPKFEKSLQVLGFTKAEDGPDFIGKPDSIRGSGDAVFCIYKPTHSMAKKHFDLHGNTVFDLSFMVEEGGSAPQELQGLGGMKHTLVSKRSFKKFPVGRGIEKFDHNTINIEMGQLNQTVCDYLSKFVLERGQFFDIKTKLTGLKSWVTRSPNLGVQIPFNEASDPKSQIQEYIEIHKGPGVQHIALNTKDIIGTMTAVAQDAATNFEFLGVPDTYYELAEKRVKIRENLKDLEKLRILVDQDQKGGYLLQIFTQNLFGGFFFELIQREGNIGFGEGNFQALFESIELDQKRRGVL